MSKIPMGFVHCNMEVDGEKRHVVAVMLSTVLVKENGGSKQYPLSSVNKTDLSQARQRLMGTL